VPSDLGGRPLADPHPADLRLADLRLVDLRLVGLKQMIEWTEQAVRQLDQAYDYIALSNSPEVATRAPRRSSAVSCVSSTNGRPSSPEGKRAGNSLNQIRENRLCLCMSFSGSAILHRKVANVGPFALRPCSLVPRVPRSSCAWAGILMFIRHRHDPARVITCSHAVAVEAFSTNWQPALRHV
jgi:hypothetical protein